MKTHIDQPRIQAKPSRGDIRITRTGLIADGMGTLAAEFESNKPRHTHLLFDFNEMPPMDYTFAMEAYAEIVDLFAASPGSIGEKAAQMLRQMRLAQMSQGA
jgi:hypothetical protein